MAHLGEMTITGNDMHWIYRMEYYLRPMSLSVD